MSKGVLLAAPHSGAGKTTLTVGIIAALRAKGIDVTSAKSGPDYIDGRFHSAVTGKFCLNLDAWAMAPDRLRHLARTDDLLVVEGAMGLFDGAPPDGQGSAADLAKHLGLPIILIVDASRQSHSIAALVHGFAHYRPDVHVAGLVLNRVGSARHEKILRHALASIAPPVLGAVPAAPDVHRPSRHLGLVQAIEHGDLPNYIGQAMRLVTDNIDLDTLISLAGKTTPPGPAAKPLSPPAQRIAIARDAAFDFLYDHFVLDWRAQGAELSFFSPLNDDAPAIADLVFLPGGYPELHAGRLAGNTNFLNGLRAAAAVYGECGGYMVMGDGLIDADGTRHEMAGLLRLETSFAKRSRHLGYRELAPLGGPWSAPLRGHEFHYATTLRAEGPPLFSATDAEGQPLPDMGIRNGNYCGSFAHVIDALTPRA
ncbi:MAG: cobyrinate a,c-diamide synthase [Pseudomonadota bacterium]